MVGGEVGGDLDLGADGVPACNRGVARVERRVIDTLALCPVKGLAREPVVAPAVLAFAAVGTVVAGLAVDTCAWQESGLKAILSGLLLVICGKIAWVQELFHNILVLADTVREHAAVVTIGINAPLHINHLAGSICGDSSIPPILSRLVVVDTNASIVAARAGSANRRGI